MPFRDAGDRSEGRRLDRVRYAGTASPGEPFSSVAVKEEPGATGRGVTT
jgi:hypothetical protein